MNPLGTLMGLVALGVALSAWGGEKAPGPPAYGDFTDSDHRFQMRYPQGFSPSPNAPITFTAQDHRAFLSAWAEPHPQNRTWKMEYENQLNIYSASGAKVIRQVIGGKGMAFTGFWEGWAFYYKEVPFEMKGKRWVLKFLMEFRPGHYPDWKRTAAACSRSLRFARDAGQFGLTPGWRVTAVDLRRDLLVDRAKGWVARNLRDRTHPGKKSGPGVKTRPVLVENGIQLFHLTSPAAFQFVMPVRDVPLRDSNPVRDASPAPGAAPTPVAETSSGRMRYVLFTYLKPKLKGQVILQTQSSAAPEAVGEDVEVMKRPRGPSMLILGLGDGACGVTDHLYMPIHGKIWEVLACEIFREDCPPGQGKAGFEGFLIPDGARGLKLLKHHWVRGSVPLTPTDDPDAGKTFVYSEVPYRFDPEKKCFTQAGEEKDLNFRKPGAAIP